MNDRRPRILVVDDEKDVVGFLVEVLSLQGHDVESAFSGEEAIEKMKTYRPHLMLLDIRMPGMGGIETLRQAKQLDPAIAVIMVTAVQEEETEKTAMALGAHAFLTKPIDFDHLNAVVLAKIIQMLG